MVGKIVGATRCNTMAYVQLPPFDLVAAIEITETLLNVQTLDSQRKS